MDFIIHLAPGVILASFPAVAVIIWIYKPVMTGGWGVGEWAGGGGMCMSTTPLHSHHSLAALAHACTYAATH